MLSLANQSSLCFKAMDLDITTKESKAAMLVSPLPTPSVCLAASPSVGSTGKWNRQVGQILAGLGPLSVKESPVDHPWVSQAHLQDEFKCIVLFFVVVQDWIVGRNATQQRRLKMS